MSALPLATDPFVTLDERQTERLHDVLRSALQVRRRNQFYLWVQGPLQSFIPHELMVCVHGDLGRRNLVVECFSSYPLTDPDQQLISNPETGLAIQLLRAWMEGGERPMVIGPRTGDPLLYRRFESPITQLALGSIAVHGMSCYAGFPGSHFLFARLPTPPVPTLTHLLDLMVPSLHASFVRMLGADAPDPEEPTIRIRQRITTREIEILQWVRDGKSNQEIGLILGISALTVKNHVQKILRKLVVQNRAQAVAKGIALKLIGNGG
jgi:transcriptional regulator EpsA